MRRALALIGIPTFVVAVALGALEVARGEGVAGFLRVMAGALVFVVLIAPAFHVRWSQFDAGSRRH
jgi:hypothetical protein